MPDAPSADFIRPVETLNAAGRGPVVLVCEHASNHIPAPFGDLGLQAAELDSHIAWDPGALGVAKAMSAALDAPLVAGRLSRLLYDCNRPPASPDAMPARSEIHDIPGNRNLSGTEKARRVQAIYDPFHAAVEAALDGVSAPVLVTMHSFTPIFRGQRREVELGILHDTDARLADAMLSAAPARPLARRNQPYGPEDGVTHTLLRHGIARAIPNVMIEVRSDLIADRASQAAMADLLSGLLVPALRRIGAEAAP